MSGSGRRIVVALALLAVVAGADSGTSRSQDVPRRERPVSAEREFTRQQVKIRRGQSLARRAMRDHRASPEVQQKAAELNTLLDHRQQVVAGLQKQHQEFIAQHTAEIDELEALRQRAHELERRLDEARADLVRMSEAEITALKQTSAQAAALADELRARYLQQRHERRQRQ